MSELPQPSAEVEAGVEPPPQPGLAAPIFCGLVGVAIMLLRKIEGPAQEWLAKHASFHRLPEHSLNHVDDLLLVPAAAVLVVFFRVTVGARMLGPFRPVLIALAFYQTGVFAGTIFLAAVMGVVVLLRPRLERGMLPYFGRLAVMLCVVVIVELVVLLLGETFQLENLVNAAVFPIVVLCLSADGFARVLAEHGRSSAVWRGIVTVLLAMLISMIGSIDRVADFLFDFPEFVLVEIALIILISTRMRWGWFEKKEVAVDAEDASSA